MIASHWRLYWDMHCFWKDYERFVGNGNFVHNENTGLRNGNINIKSMIKAGVGSSTNRISREAAMEATTQAMQRGGLSRADWALVFSTFPHRSNYKEILKCVSEITNTTNISGCSGIGVLSNSEEVELDYGVTVLAVSSDQLKATPLLTRDQSRSGYNAGIEIGKKLRTSHGVQALLTLLPDPFHIHPELLFQGVLSEIGDIPIVGASSSEDPYSNNTYQFFEDTVSTGSVSGLMLQGSFDYSIGITQGCKAVGSQLIITKAENNFIFEINGRPAFDVLKENVPSSILENHRDLLRVLFVGFAPDPDQKEIAGRDYLIRNIIGIDRQNGIIAVAENIKEGQPITFALRNPEMAREDLKQMLLRIKSSSSPEKPFKFGLYFNCCARGSSLYGQKGIDTAYINHILGDIPIIGFFGNSEIAPLQGKNVLFTYTGVLVLISE